MRRLRLPRAWRLLPWCHGLVARAALKAPLSDFDVTTNERTERLRGRTDREHETRPYHRTFGTHRCQGCRASCRAASCGAGGSASTAPLAGVGPRDAPRGRARGWTQPQVWTEAQPRAAATVPLAPHQPKSTRQQGHACAGRPRGPASTHRSSPYGPQREIRGAPEPRGGR